MTEDEIAGWHHRLDGHEFASALTVCSDDGHLLCLPTFPRHSSSPSPDVTPGYKHLESTLCRPSGWGPCQAHVRPEERCVLVMGLADAQLSLGPPHFQAHLPSFQPPAPVLLPVQWQAREQLPTTKSTLGALALPSSHGPSSGLWAAPQQGLPTLSPSPPRPPSTAEPTGSSSSPKLTPFPLPTPSVSFFPHIPRTL